MKRTSPSQANRDPSGLRFTATKCQDGETNLFINSLENGNRAYRMLTKLSLSGYPMNLRLLSHQIRNHLRAQILVVVKVDIVVYPLAEVHELAG